MRIPAALAVLFAAVPAPSRAQCVYPPAATGVPGPLIVAAPPYDLSCAGRDVLVRGDALDVVLRGGCRSVTVEGRFDRITAQLLPGAAVAIGGAAVLLNYVLVAQGPAPVVRTTLPGLQAIQIQHFGSSELVLPTSRPEY